MINSKRLCLLVFLTVSLNICAQKESNVWYFGQYAGLDFNSGVPVALTDGKLNTKEGCATISDNNGNLLFYTDGVTVWNKNHQVMLNGMGLKGHTSSSHSALIVPKPNSANIYYIFTVDQYGNSNGFRYSKVDVQLDNGLGGIVLSEKNIFMLSGPVTEKVTAIKHSNNKDFWVVSHKFNSDEFVSFLISDTGINLTPVASKIGTYIGGHFSRSIGTIKISPNGKKIAIANNSLTKVTSSINYGKRELEIFDFDSSTGEISNAITIRTDNFLGNSKDIGFYGLEFSPNSSYLYASGSKYIGPSSYYRFLFQFNVSKDSKDDIINSRIEFPAALDRDYGALQLATDGKIYIAVFDNEYLDVINKPDELGLAANYKSDAIYLGGKKSHLGLPPFIQSYFKIDAIEFENTCYRDFTKFILKDAVDSVVWDFGDPTTGTHNTSTDFESTHLFSNPGVYEVSVTAKIGPNTLIETTSITIYIQPEMNSVTDQISCDDGANSSDGLHDFDTSLIESTILNGQTDMEVHYYDETGLELPNPLPNPFVSGTQSVTVEVVNPLNASCISLIDIEFIVKSRLDCSSYPIFPKFFTPNGDGHNDIWNVKWVNNQFQANSDIFIYNRYGKLLKQIAPFSDGWDGVFNGKLLPSDDYWFRVLLVDGNEFVNHFTLKR